MASLISAPNWPWFNRNPEGWHSAIDPEKERAHWEKKQEKLDKKKEKKRTKKERKKDRQKKNKMRKEGQEAETHLD